MQTRTTIYGNNGMFSPGVAQDPGDQEQVVNQNCWETILLVEDETYVREITRELLELCGYTVVCAGDPAEAINIFEHCESSIHLLVTDVVMPGMNGRELAHRLMERCPKLRAVFISGYTENAIVRDGFREPHVLYLQKPFTMESLARKVREALDGKPPAHRKVN